MYNYEASVPEKKQKVTYVHILGEKHAYVTALNKILTLKFHTIYCKPLYIGVLLINIFGEFKEYVYLRPFNLLIFKFHKILQSFQAR